ncbi:hypothetical protein SAMN02983003_2794 [Devosia enhydra]|uniref:Outer membrane protein beta-barrel domain-containing protein n=1 Tax=Devosia enhydra TaxID=665118 RepID=A0A1K2I1J4_9HYPH|nr:hypothetical protein [Devosia enhydra]SFZ85628.1 hypothetical protein SAMN02983003_2794 [Devosia enhydra]
MALKLGVAVGALVAGMGGAYAADLYVAPVVAPVAEAAPAYWGVVELGGLGRFVTDYDEGVDAEATFPGLYGSFALWGDLGVVRVGVDGYGEWLNVGDDGDSDITNASLGVLGAHIGAGFDQAYLGVFGGIGIYPDSDDPEDLMNGYVVGVEGTLDVDVATLYGKLGYAEAANGDGSGDEGFFGYFVEGGAIFSLSDQFAVQVSGGYGFSSPFDNSSDDGYYATWGAKAAYNLGTDLNLNLVASYEGFLAQDSEDDEYVLDHTVKVGLSIPFGGAGAASALNPVATPTAPFRASVLADVM